MTSIAAGRSCLSDNQATHWKIIRKGWTSGIHLLSFNQGGVSREHKSLLPFPKQCLLWRYNSTLLHPVKLCIYLFQLYFFLTQMAKSAFFLISCITARILLVYYCCVCQTQALGLASQHGSDLDRRFLSFNCNLALMRAKILLATAISNLQKQNDHAAESIECWQSFPFWWLIK